MSYTRLKFCLFFSLFGCIGCTLAATEGASVLWDETADGDLSSTLGEPSMFSITAPGRYTVRLNTGPIIPMRVAAPINLSVAQRNNFKRADSNGDSRLQRSEIVEGSLYAYHMSAYDINADAEITLSELAMFTDGGDPQDLFNFTQSNGINLLEIIVVSYDSGGPKNGLSGFGFIDERSGEAVESGGVQITDTDDSTDFPPTMAGKVNPAPSGMEVYAHFDLWKKYRRNDKTSYFRIGEAMEIASTELIFVFE